MATAVLVTVLTMVVYNILAVVVLEGTNSFHPKVPTGGSWPARLPPIPTITSSEWLAATD